MLPIKLLSINIQFPICVDPNSYPLSVANPVYNTGMMIGLEEIITRDRIKWVIISFESFKSPDPDGIFPALLQYAGDMLYKYLVDVHNDCLRWFNIPNGYKDVRMVFILKDSKSSHIAPKDYRTSFILSFKSFREIYLSTYQVQHELVCWVPLNILALSLSRLRALFIIWQALLRRISSE